MATWYIDNRLTTGLNNGTSPENAWRSLYDSAFGTNAGSVAAGDTIELVEGSGPYREATHSNSALRKRGTDISFDSATRTITSTSTDLSGFNTAGKIIRVRGSDDNDGQYTVASATATTIVLNSSNNLVNESAGATVLIVDITANVSTPMVLDQARSGSSGNPITWNMNGCEVSAGLDVMTADYIWTESAGGTNEYYLTRADGSNPSLVKPDSAVVNGNFMCASAEAGHVRGTVGSLGDLQYGWGDGDTLGYSTLYVRSDAGNPATVGLTVIVGQLRYCVFQNWSDHLFVDGVFSFGNGTAASATDGSCIRFRSNRSIYRRCAFLYADGQAIEVSDNITATIESCIGYWCGHRFISFAATGTATVTVRNCADWSAHLFAVIGAGVTANGTLNLYNNIAANGEAGAIDKKSATAVLNEDYNCWYPRMTAAGGALGYVSAANWATTGAHDIPASTATTTSSQSSLTNPQLKGPSNSVFNPNAFKLRRRSPCRARGDNANKATLDFAGAAFPDPPNMGAFAKTAGGSLMPLLLGSG